MIAFSITSPIVKSIDLSSFYNLYQTLLKVKNFLAVVRRYIFDKLLQSAAALVHPEQDRARICRNFLLLSFPSPLP